MYPPDKNSPNTKESVRQHIKLLKATYPKHILTSESLLVIDKLEKDPDFVSSKTILVYSSLPDEVQTDLLISRHINSKNLLLPSVTGTELTLHELN